MSFRGARVCVVLAMTCLAAAACSDEASSVRGATTRDSASARALGVAGSTSSRWTQDEADALGTLLRAPSSKYRETPVAPAFVVSGIVESDGSVASDTLIQPTHDERVCRPFRDVITPHVRNGVGNAIVWIAGIASGKPNDLPRRTSIRLNDCRLEPRVHVIAEGGTVLVGSGDAMESRLRMSDILSNGTAPRAIVPLNDFGQVVPESDIARAAGIVEVSDDRHPWVHGFIAVSAHPYIAVTSGTGAFEFTGVPAGRYELIVFSESLGVMRRAVEVKANTRVELRYGR